MSKDVLCSPITDGQTDTKLTTVGTLSGFQECFLQSIIKDRPKKKTQKRPLESVEMKMSKIGLCSDLSWPKLGMESKFHEPGTFGGFGKRKHTNIHTRFMFYK